jgi:hypothetical protein
VTATPVLDKKKVYFHYLFHILFRPDGYWWQVTLIDLLTIIRKLFKKIEVVRVELSGAQGKNIHEKYLKSKSRNTVPFNKHASQTRSPVLLRRLFKSAHSVVRKLQGGVICSQVLRGNILSSQGYSRYFLSLQIIPKYSILEDYPFVCSNPSLWKRL